MNESKMHNIVSDIIAISSDGLSSPLIKLQVSEQEDSSHSFGWGFGWYPNDNQAAIVAKDPLARGTQVLIDAITDWANFRSTNFIAKVKGAAKGYTHHETQPFSRSYAGKDWLFVHNGDLDKERLFELHSDRSHFLEPLGKTDSELAFVFLLSKIAALNLRKLSEVLPENLSAWFGELDALGGADMILSDGQTTVVFHGSNSPRELFFTRIVPPHDDILLTSQSAQLEMKDPRDTFRTALIVSSVAMDNAAWTQMMPAQMLILRRGAIVWDTQATLENRPAQPAPVAPPPPPAPAQPAQLQPQKPIEPKKDFSNIMAEQAQTHRSVVNVRSMTTTLDGRPLGYRLYDLVHTTEYKYSDLIEHSTHIFRLQPEESHIQEVVTASFELTVPGEEILYEDVFGNQAIHYSINTPYNHMIIQAKSRVKVYGMPPDDHTLSRRQTQIPLLWMPWQQQMMMPYLLSAELPETQLAELYSYAMSFVERNDYNLMEILKDINTSIFRDYHYVSGSTSLSTTPFEVYANRKGVCQDFANLFICLARLLNIPARYRMGYIYTGANYENTIQSEASHAWVECYLPFVGWRGFDPTNGILVAQDHIHVAKGRNYRDATPTSGTIYKGGGTETLTVDVKIDEVKA